MLDTQIITDLCEIEWQFQYQKVGFSSTPRGGRLPRCARLGLWEVSNNVIEKVSAVSNDCWRMTVCGGGWGGCSGIEKQFEHQCKNTSIYVNMISFK